MTDFEDGQFDDAPDDEYPRIDDTELVDLTLDESIDDSDEYEEYDQVRVEDEDWEVAEKDFTKQYNRLRQHLAVRSGSAMMTATTTKPAGGKGSNVAVLPAVNHPSQSTSARKATVAVSKDQTASQLALLSSKYGSRIVNMDHSLGVGVNRKGASAHANLKDKADRATTEQVLDARTRVVLLKMVGRCVIAEINGCVSTGKEANIYHGVAHDPIERELALKIYKTSILIFKDRDRYVAGEHRFRRGYARHNPRKMVRVWAEKEMRNLKRLRVAGVRCPEPVEVRENVLVMDFLGEASQASPRLKDAESDGWEGLYVELMLTIRTIYHQCRLVHADLSEYNLLLHQGHIWIIDVGQSVEHDHPSAFDFLRSDLSNVEAFFGRRGVTVLGLRRSFGWVTNEEENEETLRKLMSKAEEKDIDDGAFKHAYIPRRLDDVYDPERDIEEGRVREAVANKAGDDERATGADEQAPNDDEGSVGDNGETPEDANRERRPRGHRHEDRDAKKERKKAVKAEARERRVQKKERKKVAGH
ncbi:RIO1-domain-containing protein [Desarmillaria ectypa]|nr:RIO1-domain-containing protein [Desarmillaria ectypa]